MLEFEPQFPRISRAVRLIAADSGDHLLQFYGAGPAVGALIERRLRAASAGLSVAELEEVETFLASLSDDQLETLCIGDQDEAEELRPPEMISAFLLRAFEGSTDA